MGGSALLHTYGMTAEARADYAAAIAAALGAGWRAVYVRGASAVGDCFYLTPPAGAFSAVSAVTVYFWPADQDVTLQIVPAPGRWMDLQRWRLMPGNERAGVAVERDGWPAAIIADRIRQDVLPAAVAFSAWADQR